MTSTERVIFGVSDTHISRVFFKVLRNGARKLLASEGPRVLP